MKKISTNRNNAETSIDLTPMLDVVFILLIFFVVTATFLSETVLSAASSDNDEAVTQPEQPQNILVELGANDEITFNGEQRPVISSQVRSTLEILKAENPKAIVVVQPHKESTVAALVLVTDSARQAGIRDVVIAEPRK